jgi:hypothetical protein
MRHYSAGALEETKLHLENRKQKALWFQKKKIFVCSYCRKEFEACATRAKPAENASFFFFF